MFKKLTDDARLPERATRYSAGFDVFANEDVVIGAGETKLIGLGIALDEDAIRLSIQGEYLDEYGELDCELDYQIYNALKKEWYMFLQTHYFALHIRSSLRAKGLTSLGTGIIDMDFTHEIKMVVNNPIMGLFYQKGWDRYDLLEEYEIKKGDKIGQLILCRHEGWLLPEEYTKDTERNGGFGSTGE